MTLKGSTFFLQNAEKNTFRVALIGTEPNGEVLIFCLKKVLLSKCRKFEKNGMKKKTNQKGILDYELIRKVSQLFLKVILKRD